MDAYGYCYQNPINLIDPTGMSAIDGDELIITGNDADIAVKELNDDSKLNLLRDSNTGKVTMADKSKIEYSKLSTQDKALYDIIDSTSETVNISTTQDVTRADASGNLAAFFLGKFNGATSTSSQNEVNMLQAVGLETGGGQSAGTTVRHEIFEGSSAIAAINNPSSTLGATSGPAFVPAAFRQSVYNSAHPRAAGMDSNYSLSNVKANQIYLNTATAPMEMWFNLSPTANSNTATGWFKIQN